MEALKDICKLILVLVGLVMAMVFAVVLWPLALLIAGFAVILLIIKYIVNGRFRR